MKKIFLFFIFAYLIFTLFALAASAAKVNLEYPLPGLTMSDITPADYFKALYLWGLGMIAAMAVVGIAYGGFMYMVGKVDQGKEIILSSLLGLLLLMGAWLILYTINPDLATLKNPGLPSPQKPPANGPPATSTPPTSYSDEYVRKQLALLGILVNKTCTDPDATACLSQTCLDDLQQTSISGVNNIKSSCGCPFTITGGTEGGCHSETGQYSHVNGYKLDLRPDSGINTYVQSKGCSMTPQDTNCTGTDGNVYRYETAGGAHWDVCFKC